MVARTRAEIERIWTGVDGIKKLTDRVIGLGPFGVGLDAFLTWVPGIGPLFSAGMGGYLLIQAMRARASPGTVMRMFSYLALDLATDIPDLVFLPVGSVVDMIFPGHLMAAKALQKDIESTHWVEGAYRDARASGAHDNHVAKVRATPGLRRVIYLHD